MHTYDASSFLHAWDNYPIEHFPPLWEWIGDQISEGLFTIPNVAFEEVDRKSPECGQWLKDQEIERLSLTNEIIQQAVRIKHLLGISEDNYHPKGVGENDLFIIATAKLNRCVLSVTKRYSAASLIFQASTGSRRSAECRKSM